MKITLLCVGKIKESFLNEGIREYSKRLSRYCRLEIIEVADEKAPENLSEKEEEQVKIKEGQRMLTKIKDTDFVVALAIDGTSNSSEELAHCIQDLSVSGKSETIWIIGGSLGLSKEVLKRSDMKLSFSKMTFPHQLMRMLVLEQIYRGFRIIKNEPYHK